jgi:hypothetical protein
MLEFRRVSECQEAEQARVLGGRHSMRVRDVFSSKLAAAQDRRQLTPA